MPSAAFPLFKILLMILLWGKTQNEHDEQLTQLMQSLDDKGLTANKDKCLSRRGFCCVISATFLSAYFSPAILAAQRPEVEPGKENVQGLAMVFGYPPVRQKQNRRSHQEESFILVPNLG